MKKINFLFLIIILFPFFGFSQMTPEGFEALTITESENGTKTYSLSLKSGRLISTNSADTIADGLACRVPNDAALDIIKKGVSRIVEVTESQIRFAIRCFFTDTHNVAEGAGAATLAAVLKEKQKVKSKRVAVILTGGNIDNSVYQDVLNEKCEGKSYL